MIHPDRLLRRVAAFRLPQGGVTDGAASSSDENWPIAAARLYDQRLTGLAIAAAEEGSLTLSSGQAEDLLSRHRDAMLQALALERHLVTLSTVLADAGVEMVLLKGSALAHTVYPDPSWRPFADLDFLVRGQDFQRACEVLAERGFRRRLPEPRARFDVRFGKAAELRGEDGLTIDLHRTLVVGPFGLWIDLDELFAGTAHFSVGGCTLRRLDDTNLLLHACIHASLGWWPPLLMPVRDVAQVASSANVDWDLVAERTRHWRLAAVVRHAFDTASQTLGARLRTRRGRYWPWSRAGKSAGPWMPISRAGGIGAGPPPPRSEPSRVSLPSWPTCGHCSSRTVNSSRLASSETPTHRISGVWPSQSVGLPGNEEASLESDFLMEEACFDASGLTGTY